MYQCIYCGNRTDDNNSPCTGCGSKDFKKYEPEKPTVITRPPQGGYTLKINNGEYNRYREEQDKKKLKKVFIGMVIMFIIFVFYIYKNTYSPMFPILLVMFGVILFTTILLAPKIIKRFYERRNYKHDHLARNGILVKNLPYKVITRDFPNHNYKFCTLEVKYEINGEMQTFMSHPFFDDNFPKDKVDLLYDPDDLSNNYIDFNIY